MSKAADDSYILRRTEAYPNELVSLIVQLNVNVILQKYSAFMLKTGRSVLH